MSLSKVPFLGVFAFGSLSLHAMPLNWRRGAACCLLPASLWFLFTHSHTAVWSWRARHTTISYIFKAYDLKWKLSTEKWPKFQNMRAKTDKTKHFIFSRTCMNGSKYVSIFCCRIVIGGGFFELFFEWYLLYILKTAKRSISSLP